jgi:hypothetical protein
MQRIASVMRPRTLRLVGTPEAYRHDAKKCGALEASWVEFSGIGGPEARGTRQRVRDRPAALLVPARTVGEAAIATEKGPRDRPTTVSPKDASAPLERLGSTPPRSALRVQRPATPGGAVRSSAHLRLRLRTPSASR